jgi:hypothetical protein
VDDGWRSNRDVKHEILPIVVFGVEDCNGAFDLLSVADLTQKTKRAPAIPRHPTCVGRAQTRDEPRRPFLLSPAQDKYIIIPHREQVQ